MSGAATTVARGMKACYPCKEDHPHASDDQLEAMRRQWGICLGATAEALESAGVLPHALRITFYREAGLAIYS